MKNTRVIILVIILFFSIAAASSYAGNPINILHSFGWNGDGYQPVGSLVFSDPVLYGMTWGGGEGGGIIFSINKDGSDFRLIHAFGPYEGSMPWGSAILSGETLYGTTCRGGQYSSGTIFSVDISGNNFRALHSFEPGPEWTCGIYGSLTISGPTLYGMSYYGGSANSGAVFSIGTNGSNFQVLHSFLGGPVDGLNPTGDLTLVGSRLYGMTGRGGTSDSGIVFSMNTDGSDFQILHSFGTDNDGDEPYGSLTASGSVLYGMTDYGGAHYAGTIFSINADGSDYRILHSFAGPFSFSWDYHTISLALSGRTLYGMTPYRGKPGMGTIFSINTDGSNYQLLHSFRGRATDGSEPFGGIVVSGSALYGVTFSGGTANEGTIFSFEPPTHLLAITKSGSGTGTIGSAPSGINCGPYCSTDYKIGKQIGLTPVPDKGSVFTGWTGACSGKGACSVLMTSDITVGATFETGSCNYAMSPKRLKFTDRGSTIAVSVWAGKHTFCVSPEVINTTDWITHTATPFTMNRGYIKVTVPPLDSSKGRESMPDAFTIAGQAFTVTQAGKPCTFSLIPGSSGLLAGAGDTGSFYISTSTTDCTWKAVADGQSTWITIDSGGEGTDKGTVDYRAAANGSGKPRTGKIVVTVSGKNKSYIVRQSK